MTTKDVYDKVKSELKSVFVHHHTKFQSCINARPRLPGEALEVFAADITRLVHEAFSTYGKEANDGELFRRFVPGLSPYLQLKVHECGATTLPDGLKTATQLERAHDASHNKLILENGTHHYSAVKNHTCRLYQQTRDIISQQPLWC